MLPVTITNIHRAFSEIKSLKCDQWEGDYRADAPKRHK